MIPVGTAELTSASRGTACGARSRGEPTVQQPYPYKRLKPLRRIAALWTCERLYSWIANARCVHLKHACQMVNGEARASDVYLVAINKDKVGL